MSEVYIFLIILMGRKADKGKKEEVPEEESEDGDYPDIN